MGRRRCALLLPAEITLNVFALLSSWSNYCPRLLGQAEFVQRRLLALRNEVTKLFGPDILAEHLFFQAHRMKNAAEPERALLFAVLSEAVETFRKFAFSKSVRGQSLFRQAKDWLWDKEADYFFSCKNICEVMGLDPCYLRRGLLQWVEENEDVTCERKTNRLPFAKVRHPQHRTLYTQYRSAIRRRSPRLKGGWMP